LKPGNKIIYYNNIIR